MALIKDMENLPSPAYTTPHQDSPIYATHRRQRATLHIAIKNALLAEFAASADMELGVSPLELIQAITDHFTGRSTQLTYR